MDKKEQSIKLNWKSKRNIPVFILLLYFFFLVVTYAYQKSFQEIRKDSIFTIIILWLVVFIIHMLELETLRRFLKKYGMWFRGLLLLLSPMISFIMVEVMVSNYNIKMFQNYGITNLIWYVVIYYFVFVITRDSKFTIIVTNFLIYILSLVNYFVYIFRGNPILPSDILAWKTGLSVASGYKASFSKGYLIATLIMFTLFVLANKLEKGNSKVSIPNRIAGIAGYVVFTVVVFHIFFQTDFIKSKIQVLDYYAPKYTYSAYGTAFGFIANIEALQMKSPKGYSSKQVAEAFAPIKANESEAEVKPNIIVIMNEAFSDLSIIGDYKTNMDYMPFTRTLTDNTIKGNLYVSVFGGATSDTEYEFLTGNSMAVMPKNCVPYQQFVTEPTDSLATILKNQGYYNIAIHPYGKSGYKRDIVYPLLGFDEFLSMDDFENPEIIRSYISDKESYKKIIEEYETKGKDSPLFIFNVTVQNHGGYNGKVLFDDNESVKLTDMPGHPDIEQYLSLLRRTDQSFQVLTDYFSKQEEPTIILIYGDHQPALFNTFHDILANKKEADFSYLYQKKYMVPFILWANYDIKEDHIDKISANYLSSYLLQVAGLQGTPYNEYLMELYKKIPVINALFYIDSENRCYGIGAPSDSLDLVTEYQSVGYNNVFDKKNRLDQLFKLKQ